MVTIVMLVFSAAALGRELYRDGGASASCHVWRGVLVDLCKLKLIWIFFPLGEHASLCGLQMKGGTVMLCRTVNPRPPATGGACKTGASLNCSRTRAVGA